MIRHIGIVLVLVALLVVLSGFAVLYHQGRQRPRTGAEYVALGSSFAAGLGLGPRVPGSPLVCQRSINGYPQQLARMAGLALVDMSCSGATVSHVLRGGQMFQGPQLDALGAGTRLVTLTAGGNDVGYVGDLTALAFRRRGGAIGWLVGRFWKGALPVAERKFDRLQADLVATFSEIRRRAPNARLVVVAYPVIMPAEGSCAQLGIDADEAKLMRAVGERLAGATRDAARAAGATVVDMDQLSAGHDACAAEPWVNGSAPAQGAPFHPTLAGAQATAERIRQVLEAAA